MYLYLVRHGQSVWNAEGRHQGWQNVPLSPKGEQQAERIADRLKDVKFDYYFTSPIKRCYDTAAAIVRAQGHDPASVLSVDEGLREGRISAHMEGRLEKELMKDWTKEQKDRFRDDYTFQFDDGEAVKTVMERTVEFFNRVAALSEDPPPPPPEESAESAGAATGEKHDEAPKIPPKLALIVAHKINLQLFILHSLDALDTVARRQTNIDRLDIANCSLSLIETNLKGQQPFYRLAGVNDITHLKE